MEWIWIGMLLAIGWFLAPYVIMLVLGVFYLIWEWLQKIAREAEAEKHSHTSNEQIIEGEIVDENRAEKDKVL